DHECRPGMSEQVRDGVHGETCREERACVGVAQIMQLRPRFCDARRLDRTSEGLAGPFGSQGAAALVGEDERTLRRAPAGQQVSPYPCCVRWAEGDVASARARLRRDEQEGPFVVPGPLYPAPPPPP